MSAVERAKIVSCFRAGVKGMLFIGYTIERLRDMMDEIVEEEK